MNPKSPVPCTLQVELLESRLLLNTSNPVANGQGAPRLDPQSVGHTVVVGSAQHATSYDAADADDGDDGSKVPVTASAVSDASFAVEQRVLLTNAGGLIRYLNGRERDRDYEIPGDRQLLKDESRELRGRERFVSVPTETPTPTGDLHTPAALAGSRTPAPAKPPVIPDPPGLSGASGGRLPGVADSASVALPLPFERDPGSQPVRSAPPPTNVETTLGSALAVLPGVSIPEAWREVFLDPLVGIPVQDAVSLNLSTLSTEADEFLSHIVNLEPDWASDIELSEYVWLAGGILLVGGGIHFARAARSSRVAIDPRLHPPTREEGQ